MQKEEQQLEKRLSELSKVAYNRDIITYSDFLNLNEQNILHSMPKDRLYTKYITFGGYDLAERQMVAFLPDALSLCTKFPYTAILIEPIHKKFAEELTHRDYLGAILNLGIERAKLGDILVDNEKAIVFVHSKLKEYLLQELFKIRHTQVCVSEIKDGEFQYTPRYEEIKGSVASIRLDALLALAFSSSRSKLSGLIEEAKVYVNGKLITNNGYQVKEDDIISVRGYGKFRYKGSMSKTKKNREYVSIHKYI